MYIYIQRERERDIILRGAEFATGLSRNVVLWFVLMIFVFLVTFVLLIILVLLFLKHIDCCSFVNLNKGRIREGISQTFVSYTISIVRHSYIEQIQSDEPQRGRIHEGISQLSFVAVILCFGYYIDTQTQVHIVLPSRGSPENPRISEPRLRFRKLYE